MFRINPVVNKLYLILLSFHLLHPRGIAETGEKCFAIGADNGADNAPITMVNSPTIMELMIKFSSLIIFFCCYIIYNIIKTHRNKHWD